MPNITEKTAQYIKESFYEMKNVTWPTQKEVKQHTILVVAISLSVAIFLGFCDYLLTNGLEQLIAFIK